MYLTANEELFLVAVRIWVPLLQKLLLPESLDVVKDEPGERDDHENDEGDGDEEHRGPLLKLEGVTADRVREVPEGRRGESPAVPLGLIRGLPEHRRQVVGVGGVERRAIEDPVAVGFTILALRGLVHVIIVNNTVGQL